MMDESNYSNSFAHACYLDNADLPDKAYIDNLLHALQNDEAEDTENEDDTADTHQRTIFEILESDEMFEGEQKDPLISNIHRAVHETIMSIPVTTRRAETPNSAKNISEAKNTHRKAVEMKDFAFTLSPHSFAVQYYSLLYFLNLLYLLFSFYTGKFVQR